MTIYTIGHSTRSAEDLLGLLHEAGVKLVADVRAFPSSRRHPQFNRRALASWLPAAGIGYVHIPGLGGRRTPTPNSPNTANSPNTPSPPNTASSPNTGWRETAFQGYADHMDTDEFRSALAELELAAAERPTAIMCAEAVWWRCHRRLIADALLARGWRVEHLGIGGGQAVHELTGFAVVGPDGALRYPPAQTALLDPADIAHSG